MFKDLVLKPGADLMWEQQLWKDEVNGRQVVSLCSIWAKKSGNIFGQTHEDFQKKKENESSRRWLDKAIISF